VQRYQRTRFGVRQLRPESFANTYLRRQRSTDNSFITVLQGCRIVHHHPHAVSPFEFDREEGLRLQ
jgi:hypothetical protein